MTEQKIKKTVLKSVEEIKEKARKAARAAIAPVPVRHYRTVVFRVLLLIITIVFVVLTFLVKITPSFPLDLQITIVIQCIANLVFGGLMSAISWLFFRRNQCSSLLYPFF